MTEPEKSLGERVIDEFTLAVAENTRVPQLDQERLQAALEYLGAESMTQVFGVAAGPDSEITGAGTLLDTDSEAGRFIGKDIKNGAVVGPYVVGNEAMLGGLGIWVPRSKTAS